MAEFSYHIQLRFSDGLFTGSIFVSTYIVILKVPSGLALASASGFVVCTLSFASFHSDRLQLQELQLTREHLVRQILKQSIIVSSHVHSCSFDIVNDWRIFCTLLASLSHSTLTVVRCFTQRVIDHTPRALLGLEEPWQEWMVQQWLRMRQWELQAMVSMIVLEPKCSRQMDQIGPGRLSLLSDQILWSPLRSPWRKKIWWRTSWVGASPKRIGGQLWTSNFHRYIKNRKWFNSLFNFFIYNDVVTGVFLWQGWGGEWEIWVSIGHFEANDVG